MDRASHSLMSVHIVLIAAELYIHTRAHLSIHICVDSIQAIYIIEHYRSFIPSKLVSQLAIILLYRMSVKLNTSCEKFLKIGARKLAFMTRWPTKICT